MEHLWSPAVATGGNRWQMERPRKRLKKAKTVAVGCDQLPEAFHAKERSAVRVRQRALTEDNNIEVVYQGASTRSAESVVVTPEGE
jgi:hypothetical protein